MSLSKSRLRSELATASYAKTKRLLAKIKTQHLVFQIDNFRAASSTCTNVAIDETLADDNIVFTRPSGPTIKAALTVQDLTYTAVTAGSAGNSLQVRYLNTATAGAEVASVVGSIISVTIQSGVSTATQVKAAVQASAPATALATVAVSGTAGTAQVTLSATNLTGGSQTEQYDLADIQIIRRLRTKKWLIRIKGTANPVQAS